MTREEIKPVGPSGSEIMKKLLFFAEKENGYFKLDKTENTFVPLVIEILDRSDSYINITLCHYLEQNGDLMRDPEMLFLYTEDKFYPYYFRNDFVGSESYSLEINENGQIKGIKKSEYKRYLDFAEIWLKYIKEQQNL